MTTDTLSKTFAALADPTRRDILARLMAGEASVSEISAPFDMTMPAVSKHLKVLENAGLITRGKSAQWRPRKLNAGPMKDISEWLESYRQHWEERLDRFDAYLTDLQKHETFAPDPNQKDIKS
ncbi:MAG: helix-turn-helix transcriptional regulator [Chloroflexi bacterium]|jgi:DNA-binding transcriptional ArsR family regulator|nr:helix-turn-helix transcriptional regulator [Chloroflexota bacterium]MBT5628634.1 helix-turn-helix transcriptional regulator [Chloroflexota bacterium]